MPTFKAVRILSVPKDGKQFVKGCVPTDVVPPVVFALVLA